MMQRCFHSSKRFQSFARISSNRLQSNEQSYFRISHHARRNMSKSMRTAILTEVTNLSSRILISPEMNITRGFELSEDDDGG
jgi:hypothetical protein